MNVRGEQIREKKIVTIWIQNKIWEKILWKSHRQCQFNVLSWNTTDEGAIALKALVHVQNKCQIQLCSVWWIREENSRVWQWLWWWQSHVWLQSIPARDSRPQIYLGQGVVEKPQDFLYLSIIPLIFFNYSVPSAQESKRKSVNCWKIWFSEVHRKLLEVRGSKSDAVMGVRVLQWT